MAPPPQLAVYPRFGVTRDKDDGTPSPSSKTSPKQRGRATSKFIARMLDDTPPNKALYTSTPELSSRYITYSCVACVSFIQRGAPRDPTSPHITHPGTARHGGH